MAEPQLLLHGADPLQERVDLSSGRATLSDAESLGWNHFHGVTVAKIVRFGRTAARLRALQSVTASATLKLHIASYRTFN
ncbi:MAG TPA: hypothetical protein DCX06_09550 [Opitutae bacterium]|nr:hypothetical protein [Opitutae bacterium]